jgi:hypothetical protein
LLKIKSLWEFLWESALISWKKENKTKYHGKIDIFMIVPLVSSNSPYIETVTIIS